MNQKHSKFDPHLLVEPFDYQVEGAEFLLRKKYAIIGDEMGLGKSLQALMVSFYLDCPTQIICPSYLKQNWLNEIDKFSAWEYDAGLGNLSHHDLSVVSFEKFQSPNKRPSLLIIDEGHYLKNPDAKRTKKVHDYVKRNSPDYLAILTGTPIKNRVDEWWSLLYLTHLARPDSDFCRRYPSIWRFRRDFCIERRFRVKGRTVSKWEGMKNLEKLKKYLHEVMIRRKATGTKPIIKEVMIDKPMKEKELELAFESEDHFSSAKAGAALLKADFTFSYTLDLLNEVECAVIFSDHVNPIVKLAEKFTEKGLKVGVIIGDTNAELRQEIVDSFNEGNLSLLLCTIGAASTGFTMTRAHHMIFNDYSWVEAENKQAMKRIDRIGQRNRCVYHIIFGGPVDKRINQTIQNKSAVLEKF